MRKLLILYVLISLFFNLNLMALKRDYNWLDDFCVTHFPYHLPPGISMDLMSLIPTTGPSCTGVDNYSNYEMRCDNDSIYQGYWDPDFKKYVLHLKNQLEYYKQYRNCTCYWPGCFN